MTTQLLPVIGNREYCAPCALSAALGLPSEIWPARPMAWNETRSAVSQHAVILGAFDFEPLLPLQAFGKIECFESRHPQPRSIAPDEEMLKPGIWLLNVIDEESYRAWNSGDDKAAGHAIAVSLRRAGALRVVRHLADNKFRWPTPFTTALRSPHHKALWVRAGVRVGTADRPSMEKQ